MGTSTFELSNRVFTLAVVLTVIITVGIASLVWNIFDTGNEYDQISVEGNVTVEMTPDVAKVSLAVVTENEDSAQAIKENTADTEAVLSAIFALGITEDDVRTESYSLYPSYEWIDSEYTETGYEVYQALEISVRDFALLSDLISTTSDAGANRFNGVEFDVEEYEAELEEARQEAIAEARAKADVIAKASGAKLGKLISYYEYTNDYDYGKGGVYMEAEAMSMDQFQPGQDEITLTVSLGFRLK